MTRDDSAHDLLIRYKGGQIEALETLYDTYLAPFQWYGVRKGLLPEDAVDAAHDAFERIIDRIDTYGVERDGVEQRGGERWMWRICQREIYRVLNSNKNKSSKQLPTSDQREARETGKTLDDKEIRRGLLWPDPLWAEAWFLGPEFVRCLSETFVGLSPQDQRTIRNRDPDHDTGREPGAHQRWRDALRTCYGDIDWSERTKDGQQMARNRSSVQGAR